MEEEAAAEEASVEDKTEEAPAEVPVEDVEAKAAEKSYACCGVF